MLTGWRSKVNFYFPPSVWLGVVPQLNGSCLRASCPVKDSTKEVLKFRHDATIPDNWIQSSRPELDHLQLFDSLCPSVIQCSQCFISRGCIALCWLHSFHCITILKIILLPEFKLHFNCVILLLWFLVVGGLEGSDLSAAFALMLM